MYTVRSIIGNRWLQVLIVTFGAVSLLAEVVFLSEPGEFAPRGVIQGLDTSTNG